MDNVLQIIIALTALVSAVGAVLNQIKLMRMGRVVKENAQKLDGRLSQIVELTSKVAKAEGVEEGKQIGNRRRDDPPAA